MATIDEYRRFLSSEYESVIEYRTVELYAPAIGVLRYVFDIEPKEFNLESGAPRDPGKSVWFKGVGGKLTEPESNDDGNQVLTIDFGGVDSELNSILSKIVGLNRIRPIELIYRKYCSLNLSQPAMTPFYFEVSGVNFKGVHQVTVVAEDAELSLKKPGRYYLLKHFEGLKSR